MALINCPECKKEISDQAKFCPNCGCPCINNMAKNVDTKETNKFTAGKIFLIVLFVLAIIAIFRSCGSSEVDSNDGKCDLCGKSSIDKVHGEEYCDEHIWDALDYYYGQD